MKSHVPPPDTLQPLLADAAARHRHLCPRQVLGVRLGLAGLRQLGLVDNAYQPRFLNHNKRLLTFVETDGCGADGVSAATGCYVGRRTLRILDYGKMAATFIDTFQATGRPVTGWRLAPAAAARDLAQAATPQARSRWHAYLEAYQFLPDEQLVQAVPITLRTPLETLLSRPGKRARCQACGEEIMNEREVRVGDRILCRGCAGEAYYLDSA